LSRKVDLNYKKENTMIRLTSVCFFVFGAALTISHPVLSQQSKITCTHEEGVEFNLLDTGPHTTTGDISGKAIDLETPVPLKCSRQGGSSMPSWWSCIANLDNKKKITATYWSRGGVPHSSVFLYEGGSLIFQRDLKCDN
jgi:hypothetical protein